ncbi:MAG TPA: hypothetical protein VM677_26390 [Actinokineospora sp.]|nr:hypothetical protein [Actinokineospora sp.]
MSPVSRGRKGKSKAKKSGSERVIFGAPEPCGCVACTGDVSGLIDDTMVAAADVLECDALEAELFGADIMALFAEGDFTDLIVESLVPGIEARSGAAAVAALSALGSVSDDPVASVARAAADRLTAAGAAAPGWEGELSQAISMTESLELSNAELTVLVATFQRADRRHTFVISVDPANCGEAAAIYLAEPEQLPELLAALDAGDFVNRREVDPAEFRWLAEAALDARAVHDEEEDAPPASEEDEFPVIAVLVRARLRDLPLSIKPKPEHGEVVHMP